MLTIHKELEKVNKFQLSSIAYTYTKFRLNAPHFDFLTGIYTLWKNVKKKKKINSKKKCYHSKNEYPDVRMHAYKILPGVNNLNDVNDIYLPTTPKNNFFCFVEIHFNFSGTLKTSSNAQMKAFKR